jgi:hypothetical protein
MKFNFYNWFPKPTNGERVMKLKMALFSILLCSAATCPTFAQTVTAFTLVGPIESFKLNPGAAATRGGTIRVHGIDAVIPNNLIVQMPATYKTPVEIFNENPGGATESGLALDDVKKPIAAFEATVVGNIVGGRHIAGLVYITQHGLANGAGYIKAINPATGLMRIGSTPGSAPALADALVMLNDKDGVYSPALTAAQHAEFNVDDRFTADTGNPTVHAETGYPMCVPGTENATRCPAGNRLPAFGNRFMMDQGGLVTDPNTGLPGFLTSAGETIPTCQKTGPGICDPDFEVPLKLGDYVNYAGTLALQSDGSSTGQMYISAHTLIASVGVYTQPVTVLPPGGTPMRAYTALEVSLVGTMGPPVLVPAASASPLAGKVIPMEAQDRLKIEGTSTDPTRPIEVYAIDVNPALSSPNNQTLRFLTTVNPPIGVPVGRYRQVLGARARALYSLFISRNNPSNIVAGATRELMVRVGNRDGSANMNGLPPIQADVTNPITTTPNGLVSGQYIAPVGEFVFPEGTGFGDPVLPANFECLQFLVNGSSPTVGQLAPWPGNTTPPPTMACGPDPK